MIIIKPPKTWMGQEWVNELQLEEAFRAYQMPFSIPTTHPEHLKLLEYWMRYYQPEELFDEHGRLKAELAKQAPSAERRRMGTNAFAYATLPQTDRTVADLSRYTVPVPSFGFVSAPDAGKFGVFQHDTAKIMQEQHNFRIFGPDEMLSNRLNSLFEATNRQWGTQEHDLNELLTLDSLLMKMVSEHQCESWLLKGWHSLFNSFKDIIHNITSRLKRRAMTTCRHWKYWLQYLLNQSWRLLQYAKIN